MRPVSLSNRFRAPLAVPTRFVAAAAAVSQRISLLSSSPSSYNGVVPNGNRTRPRSRNAGTGPRSRRWAVAAAAPAPARAAGGSEKHFSTTSSSQQSPPPQITADKAGRRASDLVDAALSRNTRLQRLVDAVEHLEDGSGDGDGASESETSDRSRSLATLLSHAGIEHGTTENFPMAPPLHMATTYTRPPDGIYKDGDSKYARMDNPTRVLLERNVFELECSGLPPSDPTCLAFSSGMQAVTSILLAHPAYGLTVLLPADLYHGVRQVLSAVFSRHGVVVRKLNMVATPDTEEPSGAEAVVEAISEIASSAKSTNEKSSVIVWMETPSNPKCDVVDIQAVCDAVRSMEDSWGDAVDVTTVVDGTMASPVLTRPLELGADISFHSGTKYLGGHSDALIGTATVSPVTARGRELYPILQSVQIDAGGVASPWDSWLTLRGMRTLHVRVERQCKTALTLAEYLKGKMDDAEKEHGDDNGSSSSTPSWMARVTVKAVNYPGLPSHPQHGVATRQMTLAAVGAAPVSAYGGVLSVELADEVEATAFAAALRVAQRATSLGGTETLIEHRASVEPPGAVVSPPGLLRVSVGLEDPNDLIRDFERAFAIVEEVMTEAKV